MNIDKLDEDYIIPKILYVDVNADIGDIKYLIWKKEQKNKGWNIIESKKWTRKGHANQKDTNIDITMVKQIPMKWIEVEYMRYEKIISDHVGVKVTINNDGFKAAKMKKRE